MLAVELEDTLAATASISTVIQFLSGILVCREFVSHGTTGEASALPFITCYMSCSMWLLYGILIKDSLIIVVNIFGVSLQLCYTITFILFSIRKSLPLKQLMAAVIFVALAYTYGLREADGELARQRIGLLSCSLTIMFFASPLTMLRHVIRVQNAATLPFPIILMSLIVCFQWVLYGYVLDDAFIKIPNLLGCILSAFQLSLFIIYPSKHQDQVRLM
ncbi:sugar transporter SWEET1 [Athalia rosae]|uniref:sugar transporter SWEET1 n=1 Tax=Athalia rosae TaxID=37344 RepID=UPI000626788E|nr:sugar transporter SWEET1 [Athalia rosae]XP_020712504.1 sugar transporter SWEET1 [Athalia rosae]